MAHYSSLFTLGLLSERASPPSSPKANIFYKFRKSSLPTKTISKPSSEIYAVPSSEGLQLSSPQFTNPFAANSPGSEASTELRSFLSLDLAADRSLNSSKLMSPFDPIVSPTSPPSHQRMPSWHRSAPLSVPARRSSRESLRTLPSPRPAPSSALPDVPSERKEPRALTPIFIPSPSLFPPVPSSSSRPAAGRGSPTSHRLPLSAPPSTTRSPSNTSDLLPSPSSVSPLSSRSFRSTRQESFMSFSSSGTFPSTRTIRRRNAERSNALACLEGRSRAPGRVSRSARQRNFMSMSDDEDEARDDEDAAGDADVEDDSDAPERSQPSPSRSSFVQSPPLPSPPRRLPEVPRFPIDEEEDRVLPPSVSKFHNIHQHRTSSSSSASKAKSRSRRGTLESWFPLANFIDLKDDELQGWRGVVEIVNGL